MLTLDKTTGLQPSEAQNALSIDDIHRYKRQEVPSSSKKGGVRGMLEESLTIVFNV